MHALQPPALDRAAEARRRELPASVAVIVLTGGLAAAILGFAGPIGWAALMTACLIIDADLYRRLDIAGAEPRGALLAALSGWAFLFACLYSSLPMALWLSGGGAASAAAMVLWIAGVVRQLGVGAGSPAVMAAGAAPAVLSLLLSPLAMAALSPEPDWDLAVIAAVGGGALMSYVAQARLAAEDAEHALRSRIRADESAEALAWLAVEQSPLEACLVDNEQRVTAMTNAMRRAWGIDETAIGRSFDDVFSWRPPHWLQGLSRALAGETVLRAEDVIATPDGVRWLVWEARPWRDGDGAVKGALISWRDVTALAEARRAAEAEAARARLDALIVDSDTQARAAARRALERVGFAVREAADSSEALAEVQSAPPALVVLDVDLGDGGGWRLLEELASGESASNIVVLAHCAAEYRGQTLSLGACEHLVKPAERELLAAVALRFARATVVAAPSFLAAPAAADVKTG